MEHAAEATGETGRPLRVLHVTATSTGGVGLLILFLIKNLDRRRFQQSVAFGRGYLLDRDIDAAGVPVYTLGTSRSPNPFSIARGVMQVYRLLSREQYDIVQSHTSVGGVIGRLAGWAARKPVVIWTVHGLGAHPGHPAWKRALLRAVERSLDWFTDHYVAVSRNLLDEGVRAGIYTADKVTVIMNGLRLDHVPAQFNAGQKRRELGIPEGAPVIGTVTRLEAQKANDQLLRAVARIVPQVPDLVVLVAGDGPLRTELEALAESLGVARHVRFLGWRTDAVELLGVLDVFCMSSRWEGCPMVLLEAMATRRAVVSTSVGGIPEMVVDGETGLLVAPGDWQTLAERILRLLKDPAERSRMGEAGRRRVEQRFGVDEMLEAYASLYRALAAGRGSAL